MNTSNSTTIVHDLDPRYAIVADVGGTNLRVGLANRTGAIERLSVTSTPTNDTAIIEELLAQIAAVGQGVEGEEPPAVVGVGVGLPGRLRNDGERWSHALNLGVSSAVALRSRLEPHLSAPLSIANDVGLATLGAAHHFSHIERLAYLSVGTGIAGGGISRAADGSLPDHGQFVGEIGHVPVPGLATTCVCGQTGCVESAAGGNAMLHRWSSMGGEDVDGVAGLWDAADAGDGRAQAIRGDCIVALSWAVRLYVIALGADAVVVGGGVSRLGSRLGDELDRQLESIARTTPLLDSFELPRRMCLAPPVSEFGLLGATHLVFDQATSA